ncbi:hypothetical protein D3C75_932590 [compost metagenome]
MVTADIWICTLSRRPPAASSWAWVVERLLIIAVNTAMAKEPNALRVQLLMDEAWPDSSLGICSMP